MKKPTRGGARKGSGRRALGKVVMLLRVKPETRKSIQAEAVASGATLGAVIDAKFNPVADAQDSHESSPQPKSSRI